MQSTNSKLIRNTYFMISGLGGFLVFSILAMVFYSGGSEFEPHSSSYNFSQNFISDLGLVTTPSGQSNIVSITLFAIAMFMIGIFSIPFMFSFYQQFPNRSVSRYFAIIGGIIGIVSAFGYIAVGLTPMDQVSSLHSLSVSIAFGGTLWAAFFFGVAIFLSHTLPKKYGFLLIGIAVIISLFVLLQVIVAGSWNPFIRTLTVVGQKITVYVQLVLLLFVGIGILQTYRETAKKIQLNDNLEKSEKKKVWHSIIHMRSK